MTSNEPKDSRNARPHVGTVIFEGSVFDVAEGRDRKGRIRHSLNCPDWAVVVAIAEDGRLVMVNQQRYATGLSSLEPPGGAVDDGEVPVTAAARELREETGYEVTEILSLGWMYPNPAIMDNRVHMFLARAHKVGETRSEDAKTHAVRLMTVDEVRAAVAPGGEVTHALHALLIERALARLDAEKRPCPASLRDGWCPCH